MSDDGLVLVLAALEEPVSVRPEFAQALRTRLHAELGFAVAAPVAAGAVPTARAARGVPAAPAVRRIDALRRALASLWPTTPRVAVLALLALLLIAGTVVAGIIVVRSWLSSEPRGVQYTNDFTYAEVYREPAGQYDDLVLAPDGGSAYAVRVPKWAGDGSADPGGIVRFELADGDWSAPVDVLPFDRLRDASLWDPGVDLSATTISQTGAIVFGDGLSVAPDGSLVVGIAASTGWDTGSQRVVATSLVAIRPDGSGQKVVTGGELRAAGLVGDAAVATAAITGVASGPDWIWARAETPVADPAGSAFWLLEIVDPTRDGDWSDRVVRPLVLPADVPRVEPGVYDSAYGPFVAEPSVGGHDRSRSILLPILRRTGEVAIYRVSDPDGDGNATDPGETALLYSGTRASNRLYPVRLAMTPRVVLDGSTVVLDELLVAGLSRETRVSRITPGGLVDIMRGLPSTPDGLMATRDGSIYVPLQVADDGASPDPETGVAPGAFALVRLVPVPVGERPPSSTAGASAPAAPSATPSPTTGSPSPAASPTPEPSEPVASATPARSIPPGGPILPLGPITPGVAQAAATISSEQLSQAFLLGADGSGPALAIPGTQVLGFCQSADASLVAFSSADAVPNEYWLYVAGVDGAGKAKVTDMERVGYACPFAAEAIVLYQHGDPLHRVYLHDLATDKQEEVGRGTVLAASPDGRSVAIATGDGERTLALLDVVTGAVRTLAGPFEQKVFAAWWSTAGDRLAYGVAPFSDCCDMGVSVQFDIRLIGLDGRGDRSLVNRQGRFPEVSWSADDANVLVRVPIQGATASEIVGDAQIIELASGATRPVGNGDVVFAGWSPVDAATYAYATPSTLFLATLAGEQRKVADKPSGPPISREARWPVGGWAGWSPDGAYIGLGLGDGCCEGFRVTVVEVATGTTRLLVGDSETVYLDGWEWWRQPGSLAP